MNPKNTVLLLLTLIVLAGALYALRAQPGRTTATSAPTGPRDTTAATRDLIEDEFADFVKVSIKRRERPEWVFEKKATEEGGADEWHMTAPHQFKVVSWEVEKFPRQIGELRYDISYEPGQAGAVTAAKAGLEPPQAVVTMTDTNGKSVSVEIGGPASEREMYVRLAGTERICVGKSSLTGLFKNKAVEYRDKLLWSFDGEDAVRLEVVDRSGGDETHYAFVRDGARWMIEAPFTARATAKVADAVNTLARLRAIQWQDDDADKLAIYGLDTAALTVRVTVEEEVDVEDDTAEANDEASPDEQPEAPPRTETKTAVYELHVSDRSPIGEDTKTYVRVDDEAAVATVMKTVVDKLKPDMTSWRDMQVTPVDVTTAITAEVRTQGGSFTAQKEGSQWRRQSDDSLLDAVAIDELLGAAGKLSAAAYVDAASEEASGFGFDHPQADIRFVVPGVEQSERIVVGDPTDPTSKRLVYVRRNDSLSVGKVRTADVEKLIRAPVAYIDRTVLNLVTDRVVEVSIESTNPLTRVRQTAAYGKNGGTWSMIAPVAADLRPDAMEKLVAALADLRALRAVAESDQSTAFGLHDPAAVVTITYESTAGAVGESSEAGGTESLVLQFARHDGSVYARRANATSIFEVGPDLLDQLEQEFRQEQVWTFQTDDVTGFGVKAPDGNFRFERRGGQWAYAAEPDLPLDAKKVEELLLRIRDLKIVRYVDPQGSIPTAFGLEAAQFSVTVTEAKGTTRRLVVSQHQDVPGHPVGAIEGVAGVFALEANATDRFSVSLAELEAKDN